MGLDRTDAVLTAIESADAAVSVVESFLAQYAAVVLYSEMEEHLSELIQARLSKYTHEAVATFISTSLREVIRRTPKSNIADFSGRFGDTFKVRFNELVDDREVTRYMNVIAARHDVGHRRGSNITVAEVRLGHLAATHIIGALDTCFDEICGPLGN